MTTEWKFKRTGDKVQVYKNGEPCGKQSVPESDVWGKMFDRHPLFEYAWAMHNYWMRGAQDNDCFQR